MSDPATRRQDCSSLGRNTTEEKALADLYDEYYPQIRRYIASCTSSSADADDLAQDVFLEFCKSNRYHNAEAYLFGIARKTVLANHRKRKKKPNIIPVDSIDGAWGSFAAKQGRDPTSEISQKDSMKLFADSMKKLPPKALEAVKLRLIMGLSPGAAAKEAGCPIDTFYRRLYQGLKALRNSYSRT